MKKNKFISIVLIFFIMFGTFFSFSNSYAATGSGTDGLDVLTVDELKERLQILQTNNPFEMTISELLLSFGDMIMDYMTYLFKDELTIDRLVFNKVISLNANFFEFEKKGLVPTATEFFCDAINEWYSLFKGVAIVAYLIVLVLVGIKIMLGLPNAKAKAQDIFVKWGIGIAILFLFPYVMKYAFKLNDAIINEIRKTFSDNSEYEEIVGSYVGKITDLQYDQVFEERSPEYISRSDYIYSIGSSEATYAYIKEMEKYKERGDVMRIMRAMAGVTGKLIYVILWLIMLWQVLVLTFMYTKRYLMIAFLIMIFPITIIEYIIGAVKTGKGGGFSAWCMEFFLNVFIQTIHAIAYGMIGGVVMANVRNGIANGGVERMNWIILIIAINFIFEAEGIIKKIIKANAASIKDAAGVAQDIKGFGTGAKDKTKKFAGSVTGTIGKMFSK